MSFQHFYNRISAFAEAAGVKVKFYIDDLGRYTAKGDGIVILGRPSSKKVTVKQNTHKYMFEI